MMDSGVTILVAKIAAVILLVLLNGFFVAAEFGLVKLRDSQLRALEKKGARKAKYAREALANLDASLSACQLGITLASLGPSCSGSRPSRSSTLQQGNKPQKCLQSIAP